LAGGAAGFHVIIASLIGKFTTRVIAKAATVAIAPANANQVSACFGRQSKSQGHTAAARTATIVKGVNSGLK
jgi:hypothetical protein